MEYILTNDLKTIFEYSKPIRYEPEGKLPNTYHGGGHALNSLSINACNGAQVGLEFQPFFRNRLCIANIDEDTKKIKSIRYPTYGVGFSDKPAKAIPFLKHGRKGQGVYNESTQYALRIEVGDTVHYISLRNNGVGLGGYQSSYKNKVIRKATLSYNFELNEIVDATYRRYQIHGDNIQCLI